MALGKQKYVGAACLKDNMEFKCFFFESSYLRISYDMFNTSIDMVITDHMIQTSQGFFNIYAKLKDNSIVVSQNTWQFYNSNNIVDYRVRLRLVKSIFWLDVHGHAKDKATLMTFPRGILIILDRYRQLLQIMWATCIAKSVHLANYVQSSWGLFKFKMAPKSYWTPFLWND